MCVGGLRRLAENTGFVWVFLRSNYIPRCTLLPRINYGDYGGMEPERLEGMADLGTTSNGLSTVLLFSTAQFQNLATRLMLLRKELRGSFLVKMGPPQKKRLHVLTCVHPHWGRQLATSSPHVDLRQLTGLASPSLTKTSSQHFCFPIRKIYTKGH